jgi:NodT family efflux transporter outer membrane factor (OMF) lipoprotein
MKVAVLTLALLTLMPGCARLCHRSQKPEIQIPAQFSETQESSRSGEITNWWKSFDDPLLDELIERAVRQNYDLKVAIEKIEETRALYRIKTAELLPEIDGFGIITRNRYSKEIPFFAPLLVNPANFEGLGLTTSWELDLFGRLRSARNAAYADYQAQIEHMRDVYIILVSDVAQYYIQARATEQKIKISEKQLALDKEVLTLAQDLFQGGLLDDRPSEVQQQQLQESSNNLTTLKKILHQTYHSLAVLVGEAPEGFKLASGDGRVPMAHAQLRAGLPSELLRRRPDIRQAEQNLIATDERIKESIAGFFPKFSLLGFVASLSTRFCTWFNGNSLAWTIGPAFSWPIITFGRITYDVKAKKSAHRQALSTYSQTLLKAFADVENALVNYFTQQERLALYEKKLQAALKEAALFETRFKAGLADRSQYLLSEKSRLEVLSQLTDTQRELSAALVTAYKALGGGWE